MHRRGDKLAALERRHYGDDTDALTPAEIARLELLRSTARLRGTRAGSVAGGTDDPHDDALDDLGSADSPALDTERSLHVELPTSIWHRVATMTAAALITAIGAFLLGRGMPVSAPVAPVLAVLARDITRSLGWDAGSADFVANLGDDAVFAGTMDHGRVHCVALAYRESEQPHAHLCAPASTSFTYAASTVLSDPDIDVPSNELVSVAWPTDGRPTIAAPGSGLGDGTRASPDSTTDIAAVQTDAVSALRRAAESRTGTIRWLAQVGPYQVWQSRSPDQRCVMSALVRTTAVPGLTSTERATAVCDVPDADRFVLRFPAVASARTTATFPSELEVRFGGTSELSVRARP